MKEPVFTGVCTALITPFDEDGYVNLSMLERLIDRQLHAGVAAIALCGTTGEAATLRPEERKTLVRHAARYIDGRCRVVAGAGTNSTADAVRLARDARDSGADALLVVTPYYNKTTQAGLLEHYEAVAGAVDLPVIVYNVPSRTGMTIAPETYLALSRIENINGVKEASGDLAHASRIRNLCHDELNLWSGSDETAVAMMAVGAKGLISTTSNLIPRKFVRMINACEKGDYFKAGDMQNGMMPLIDAMFREVNPIPIKTAMEMAGYDAGPCRGPLCACREETRQILIDLLAKVHIE